MGRSGGVYTRDNGLRQGASIWSGDQAAGVKITTAQHDYHDQDMANAISAAIFKDGTSTISAAIPFNSQKITGLGTGTAATDAATVAQTQSGATVWGGTSGGSANAQTLSLSPAIGSYTDGLVIRFTAGFTNTGSLTLNVNSLGAKNVFLTKGEVLTYGEVIAGEMYDVLYQAGFNGFALLPRQASTTVLQRNYTGATVSNTSLEGDLHSKTILANTLLPGRILRTTFAGLFTNSSGGLTTLTIRCKFGGTNDAIFSCIVANGSTSPFKGEYIISSHGTSTQKSCATLSHYDSAASPNVGVILTASSFTGAINGAANQTLKITGQPGATHVNCKVDLFFAFTEYL